MALFFQNHKTSQKSQATSAETVPCSRVANFAEKSLPFLTQFLSSVMGFQFPKAYILNATTKTDARWKHSQ
jgi:hypothetical protein